MKNKKLLATSLAVLLMAGSFNAFAKENKKHVVEYNEDRTVFYEQINKLYDSVIGSNINN